jgi:hypothetical protein
MRQHAFNDLQQLCMGQTTRSQGISFTYEMWEQIDARCRELKFGRSQYFQMLADWDLRFHHKIHPHRADGKWHFYPESEVQAGQQVLRAAEGESPPPPPAKLRRRSAK